MTATTMESLSYYSCPFKASSATIHDVVCDVVVDNDDDDDDDDDDVVGLSNDDHFHPFLVVALPKFFRLVLTQEDDLVLGL